jgi:hypothetical protein
MKNKSVLGLGVMFLFPLASAQAKQPEQSGVSTTEIHAGTPRKGAHIVKYFVDQALPDSGYETGSLHLVYSDGIEIVETIPAKKKSTEDNVVFSEEGITDPKVAPDKRSVGWTENFDNCCTSYSVPLVLTIYNSGKRLVHIQQGQMVWYWTFRDGGKRVAVVWGPTHGPEVGDFQLYDVKTARKVAEVYGEQDTQSLRSDAPEWAKQTEKLLTGR